MRTTLSYWPCYLAHSAPLAAACLLIAALLAGLILPILRPAAAAAIAAPLHFPLFSAQSLHNSCTDCHRFDRHLSHPVGIRAEHPPAGLVLENGLLSCITCHDSAAAAGHHLQPRGGEMYLRTVEGGNLCISCHTDPRTREGAHAALGRAHLNASAQLPTPTGSLDAESQACMSCHDGAAASDAAMDPALMAQFARFGDAEHPIGIPHMERMLRDRTPVRLIPSQRLDPRIRLFDGALGCGSCHSPYAPHQRLLVMDNQGSQLCLSCHAE